MSIHHCQNPDLSASGCWMWSTVSAGNSMLLPLLRLLSPSNGAAVVLTAPPLDMSVRQALNWTVTLAFSGEPGWHNVWISPPLYP